MELVALSNFDVYHRVATLIHCTQMFESIGQF